MKTYEAIFTCRNCGECCGPIPVTDEEWRLIRRAIKHMPQNERMRLKGQERPFLTCPLRDMENNRCSAYDARPLICRMQGEYEGLPCPHQPEKAVKTKRDGYSAIKQYHGDNPVMLGILAITHGWNELLEGME